MSDSVHELLATEVALAKLAARRISAVEAGQLINNRHITVGNPLGSAAGGSQRLMIGLTDGGHSITLVIEHTIEPTTWMIVTGRNSTAAERRILPGSQ